jgi:hypothetical protein
MMTSILIPSNASELYLSAIAHVVSKLQWEFVTFTPADSKEPSAFATLGNWVEILLSLPKGIYVLTEY